MSTPPSHAIVIKSYEWWNTAASSMDIRCCPAMMISSRKKQFHKHNIIRLETIIPSVAGLARCWPLTYGPRHLNFQLYITAYFNFTAASCSINGELSNCTRSGSQASTSIKLPESAECALHYLLTCWALIGTYASAAALAVFKSRSTILMDAATN